MIQPERLDLPATKKQPLRLSLTLRHGDIDCAAYLRSNRFEHIVFACGRGEDDWHISESSNDDYGLWIGRTAFKLDPKHADKVRAFLAHTKAAA